MILIGLVAVARFHELVTRDSRHRIEQALVADAASSHLGLHHVLAFDREAIGLEFGNQRRSRILLRSETPMWWTVVIISCAAAPGRRC